MLCWIMEVKSGRRGVREAGNNEFVCLFCGGGTRDEERTCILDNPNELDYFDSTLALEVLSNEVLNCRDGERDSAAPNDEYRCRIARENRMSRPACKIQSVSALFL